jgi:heme oxygenase
MSLPSVAHERLRFATRDAHQALEADLDAVNALSSAEGRRRLAPRYLDFHAAADALFERWLAAVPGLDDVPRRRTELVRAGLRDLGVQPASSGRALPPVTGVAQALGFLYVVEGSTLGGRMILREVAARGGDLAGLGFMDPYGPRTGEAWRAFLAVLEREVANDPDRLDQAETGARAGFAYARACLCGAP